MSIIAERTFTAEDQRRFATLSGDANPIHIDEVAARRFIFGAPVVHGVHLLCWALESWLVNGTTVATALAKLTATFSRGVLVGETVQVAVVEEADEFALRIRRGQANMALIRGSLSPVVEYTQELPPLQAIECREMDFATASQAQGVLPLSYCRLTAKGLFPHLSAVLPSHQLAALLATTRLVGMECPGLHSLYSAVDITFDKSASGRPQMSFRTDDADSRFGLLHLKVKGPGFHGKLRAFLRPPPRRQAGVKELSHLVKQDEFVAQRAVVVGGSRGLGEVAAKLLALGGAEVMITFHRGKEDAEAVAIEIESSGGRCSVARFDVINPEALSMRRPVTHLYYFATPQITSDKTDVFSTERFVEYCRYYVSGFVQTLRQVADSASPTCVFYPSSIFLSESAHMPEYCAAKGAGEEVCRQLASRFPMWHIYAPRLPRIHTDQTNTFVPSDAAVPETVILDHLRRMNEKSLSSSLP